MLKRFVTRDRQQLKALKKAAQVSEEVDGWAEGWRKRGRVTVCLLFSSLALILFHTLTLSLSFSQVMASVSHPRIVPLVGLVRRDAGTATLDGNDEDDDDDDDEDADWMLQLPRYPHDLRVWMDLQQADTDKRRQVMDSKLAALVHQEEEVG